ncbi:BREX-1 system adenine-specific DNA-methyltransferase PglX [Janibacter sp. UYMM211]|uniref:BREX-1 system adenine-specific DNA-methyltransferase PglX n=1 Tax=Janibacter sp. UYMM211 TaxID=3156342 RepID=UPI003393BFFA
METAPLKNFATWARKELIREVTARIAAVLAPGSSERVEQAKAVAALEKAVTAAGGGDKGRASVADKVAYTWFNRIIALRFMDATGYSGIGVVSPQAGVEVGQPEILAEAKRGVIDADVVSDATRKTVAALLDGTRISGDSQGETYALLLESYCNHWHKFMPFMFEREGDFTELLVPANLLADDSVLDRAVKVLSEHVCQDVEVIGWLYQFYISERKDEVFAGFKKNKRAGADEIPAATQLFTPHWIVRYLVENSLGRLWMLNRPNSGLACQMDYYIAPVDDETDFLKITKPEELKVIDPACGSGHMLTYAFDLLYAIYEEEGYGPGEIPGLILTHNLFGTEIDPRAAALAAFALTMKARASQRSFFSKRVEANICVIDPISFSPDELDFLLTGAGDRHAEEGFWNQFAEADTFGALVRPDPELIVRLERHLEALDHGGDMLRADVLHWADRVVAQAKYLAPGYSVVVTNPPYMGSGNMSAPVSAWVKDSYPDEKQDLYACFVVRSDELVVSRGYIAMVTGDTWMTIKSFEKLRRRLLAHHAFLSFVHMHDVSNHPDIFGANTAFVIAKDGRPETGGAYVYLDASSSNAKSRHLRDAANGRAPERVFFAQSAQFEEVPGAPLAFRISGAMRRAFHAGQPMIALGEPRQGMATADNGRFLRLWFEVSGDRLGRGMTRAEAAQSEYKWFPYNKGGEYRKWYGNQDWVVNWQHDGAELLAERPKSVIRSPQMYFLPSVSWSKVGTGIPAFRYFPKGFLFDVAGTSIFAASDRLYQIAAVCNSNVVRQMLAAISPTLNVEVGTISQLPVVDVSDEAVAAARELIEIHRDDWNEQETSCDFSTLSLISVGQVSVQNAVASVLRGGLALTDRVRCLETEMNTEIAKAYGLDGEVDTDVPLNRVTLNSNPWFRYGVALGQADLEQRFSTDRVVDLVSYAVGCMFGRYSLDEPGLILADQGATWQDYLARVPAPTFIPDADNVIPIVDGDWFEDDIVERFRKFLRAAFGEQNFEENLRFIAESLGVKNLRDYFVKSFYKDHVQRYKKRPIYWLFSSPRGSFNALIYMHRYTPSTVSTVLNEYLREFQGKLKASLDHAERSNNAKEADRLRQVLLELDEYEHDVLYPLASQNLAIDLDDGVKANYPEFGTALKKIVGLEATV